MWIYQRARSARPRKVASVTITTTPPRVRVVRCKSDIILFVVRVYREFQRIAATRRTRAHVSRSVRTASDARDASHARPVCTKRTILYNDNRDGVVFATVRATSDEIRVSRRSRPSRERTPTTECRDAFEPRQSAFFRHSPYTGTLFSLKSKLESSSSFHDLPRSVSDVSESAAERLRSVCKGTVHSYGFRTELDKITKTFPNLDTYLRPVDE